MNNNSKTDFKTTINNVRSFLFFEDQHSDLEKFDSVKVKLDQQEYIIWQENFFQILGHLMEQQITWDNPQ